jgi:outer membrane protein TolC
MLKGWDSSQLEAQLKTVEAEGTGSGISLTLEQAINMGVSNSPQLAIAYREIQRQEWELIAARRDWYPQATISAQPIAGFFSNSMLTSYRADQDVAGRYNLDYGREFGTYMKGLQISPSAMISWRFFDIARGSEISSQQKLVDQQKFLFNVTARSLLLDIETEFYALQSLAGLIQAYTRLSQENIREVKVMEERFKVRLATVSDVEQSKAQALNQMNQLIDYKYRYQEASSNLAQLLSLETSQLIYASQKNTDMQYWPLSLDETLRQGLSNREEIKASLAQAESYQWEARALMQRYIPTMSVLLGGNLNLEQGVINGAIGGLDMPQPPTGTLRNTSSAVGLGFTWDIFDGGIRAAQSNARRAQAQQQRDQAQQNRLTVVQQIKTAYAAYQTQYQSLINSRAAVTSALQAQSAARERYRVGIGDITTLIQATGLYGDALANQALSEMRYSTAVASLYRYSAVWPMSSQEVVIKRKRALK